MLPILSLTFINPVGVGWWPLEGPAHSGTAMVPSFSLWTDLASDEHNPLLGTGAMTNEVERLPQKCGNVTSFSLGYLHMAGGCQLAVRATRFN